MRENAFETLIAPDDASALYFAIGEAVNDDHAPHATGDEAQRHVSADSVLFEKRAAFGTVFVLCLGEFFRALGGRTERMATSLQLMGESVLRRRMGPSDNFSFHPEGFFLIRLHGNDPANARLRAEDVVDALGRRALGERFISWHQIRATVAENNGQPLNDDWAAGHPSHDDGDDIELSFDYGLNRQARLRAYRYAAR